MSLEFHLTHYERYRKEGIDAHRRGDPDRARFNLLKAAEHLYSVANRSDGRIKEERTRRAGELLSMARDLSVLDARRRTGPRDRPAREGDDDGDPGGGDRFRIAERPDVTFEQIAGLEDVKEEIRLKIIYPFLHRDRAEHYGIRPGGGILLYGPPGTGKTLLACAVAGEVECAFFTVKPSEILSKWVGDAEKNLAGLFDAARADAPSVIFIDEVDALAPKRSESRSSVMARLVPQILAELEGFSGKTEPVLFIGATNEPWSLDPAILRPGRFDEMIYVGLPDPPARLRILEIHLEGKPLAEDVDLVRLGELLDGCSGADLRNLCRKAADDAFLRAVDSGSDGPIDQLLLLRLAREIRPSVSPKALQRFQQYRERGA
ncbi:MAG: ATP-binding protein [Planctomycetota bacterium]